MDLVLNEIAPGIMTAVNVCLEGFYLYLIKSKSPPEMAAYRIFLSTASICGILNSLTTAIISPRITIIDHGLRFDHVLSNVLPPSVDRTIANFHFTFGFAEIQLHLIMILHASINLYCPSTMLVRDYRNGTDGEGDMQDETENDQP
ncbi:hypothetical protein QR680_015575 [Steinernema hermaphroditum]|uniref:Uncharacterized protein n=1 Tax=Steinernema hermaphroditum TaxID=289476 RepID=A0AA39LL01_9BILA|nr:hypothetical protein QR680_015575 [Steinernema hermaphroditum]